MPENPDKKTGEEALRVIRGVLDGTIPSDEVAKTGIRDATPESVRGVLEENTVVTKRMGIDAKAADFKHKQGLDKDY